MRSIAVLTSGGDAPGMNTAIRAVVRSGFHYGLSVYGVYEGFKGLVEDDIRPLEREHVSRILNRGGTVLRSARIPEFSEEKYQRIAVENLRKRNIHGLVVIGGDGSFKGALALHKLGIKCIGLPGTIDNDIAATDYTIGFFTALNTAMESIDKLRDTSFSHQRCSVVEVMGRHCGDLALYSGIAVGSEFIITPETGFDREKTLKAVQNSYERNKRHAIIVVTENMLDVQTLAKDIQAHTGYETRATVLGHVQRGGSPSAFDRVMATEMTEYAVELLSRDIGGKIIGLRGMNVVDYNIEEALEMKKKVSNKRYGLVGKLVNNEVK